MIRSFRGKDTQALFEGRCPRRWQAIRRVAERKLIQLNAAATLDFLRAPPGNRLEALKGDREGQYSIRINEQWRVCFTWEAGDVFDVEIVDLNVAMKREVGMLPILYNCGLFICFIGNIRSLLRRPFGYA